MKAKDVPRYRQLHLWVQKELGKPQLCSECGDNSDKKYQWSNISGDYLWDLKDWRRLCLPCHARVDDIGTKMNRFINRTHCMKGHEYTPENTRYGWKKTSTHPCRICKECGRNNLRRWRAKQKAKVLEKL